MELPDHLVLIFTVQMQSVQVDKENVRLSLSDQAGDFSTWLLFLFSFFEDLIYLFDKSF